MTITQEQNCFYKKRWHSKNNLHLNALYYSTKKLSLKSQRVRKNQFSLAQIHIKPEIDLEYLGIRLGLKKCDKPKSLIPFSLASIISYCKLEFLRNKIFIK
jgi:hypothetical protein